MNRGNLMKWGAVLLLVALVALAVWKWSDWQASAHASSAYAARMTCSCRYVEGRSAESCAQDIADEVRFVSLTETPQEKRVAAHVPLLGTSGARFRPGYGCLMEP